MEALAGSSSKLFAKNYINRAVSSSRALLTIPQIRLFRSQKLNNVVFSHSIFPQFKGIESISSSSFSSETQADEGTAEALIQVTDKSKTVRVKFQLRKECLFGQQFLLVGDDPIFGLWDPSNAIPLDWSDGHIWTVELDIPLGKPIQFKFILKGDTGEVVWQPGPDRILQTWETKNTIIVSEDWENAEIQKITEEQMAGLNREPMPMVNPNIDLIIPENITYPKEEPKANVNKESIVVENLTFSKEKPMTNPKKELTVAEKILGSNGRAVTDKKPIYMKDEVNLVIYEGEPVLVPGLTPLPTGEAISKEVESSSVDDAPVGADEAEDQNIPEKHKKQESNGDQHQEETTVMMFDGGSEEEPRLIGIEEKVCQSADDDVLQNDIQWGHKTLRKLLANLGFL